MSFRILNNPAAHWYSGRILNIPTAVRLQLVVQLPVAQAPHSDGIPRGEPQPEESRGGPRVREGYGSSAHGFCFGFPLFTGVPHSPFFFILVFPLFTGVPHSVLVLILPCPPFAGVPHRVFVLVFHLFSRVSHSVWIFPCPLFTGVPHSLLVLVFHFFAGVLTLGFEFAFSAINGSSRSVLILLLFHSHLCQGVEEIMAVRC